jgi:hypothetical protein
VKRARVALAAAFVLACAGSPTREPDALPAGLWSVVDADSEVHFVGIKNDAVGVVGVLANVSGTFDSQRGDNIKTHFFEQAKYPVARFTVTRLPQLEMLPPEGHTADYELAGTLEMHGTRVPLVVPVRVTHEDGARLRVRNRKPIVLNAKDFGMEAQLALLKAVCGHESLSGAVPIELDVVFAPAA